MVAFGYLGMLNTEWKVASSASGGVSYSLEGGFDCGLRPCRCMGTVGPLLVDFEVTGIAPLCA